MATTRTSGLNRKQRRELRRRLQAADPGLEVMHPNAAGIDIGNSAHYVAVRPDRDPDPVRRFDCFTAGLHRSPTLPSWARHTTPSGLESRCPHPTRARVRMLNAQTSEPPR